MSNENEEAKKKVGVQVYFDEAELAELRRATFCDLNTEAVRVAVRAYINATPKRGE